MPDDFARLFDVVCWTLLVAGFALVVASWSGRAPQKLGWVGLWLGISAAAAAWVEPLNAKITVLAIGAVVIALQLKPRRRKSTGVFAARSRRAFKPWDQEGELLRLCHGDKQMADRLIEHERNRDPKLSRAGAALAAATRLKHDKR